MRYSDLLADWLQDLGYTHCFFVAGGNIMHLLASISKRLTCIPVVHEVTAGIATEYFNESGAKGRAFALVTAGPGLTNIVTALAGAWLDSRELLVLGGQVKTDDLSRGALRQRGIQEINGVDIVKPITVRSVLMDHLLSRSEFTEIVRAGSEGRKGPVFIEIPLDIQGRDAAHLVDAMPLANRTNLSITYVEQSKITQLIKDICSAKRPVLLLGGGVSRETTHRLYTAFATMGVPVMTTWNGADRISADHPLYFGRPNTWGQRYSNILLQQTDLLVALGTRLGMQQTGFNWQEFVPVGKVVQVDCDQAELEKGHPKVNVALLGDANRVLEALTAANLGDHQDWIDYCAMVKKELPVVEPINQTGQGFLSPYLFARQLSILCADDDVVIPCSSGSAFTVMMQAFNQKQHQVMVTNKGLASMGYGLSGAIGAAFAHPDRRVVLVEGDGGFSQNLQELGTASVNTLNLKIFIFDDNGYASIRMTQRNYFGGEYVGCDTATGLGMPDWEKLFDVYNIPVIRLHPGFADDMQFSSRFNAPGVAGFIVQVDPEQTYFPKITSRVTETGGMLSNPLHIMTPELDPATWTKVSRFLG